MRSWSSAYCPLMSMSPTAMWTPPCGGGSRARNLPQGRGGGLPGRATCTLSPMQSIIDILVQWATGLIGDWGLPAVFFLMLLESACIPVPSEAIMPFAGFAVSEGDMTLLGITVAG